MTVLRSGTTVRGLSAVGHARILGNDYSLPCAAASVLLRTAARTLESVVPTSGGASDPGVLEISLGEIPPSKREWTQGVIDMVITGLLDLTREFPEEVAVDLLEVEGEHRYGT